jgi:hypothetical protein
VKRQVARSAISSCESLGQAEKSKVSSVFCGSKATRRSSHLQLVLGAPCDEVGGGRADQGRPLAAPGRRLHEVAQFLRWQVRLVGHPLAGSIRAPVRGDERVLVGICTTHEVARTQSHGEMMKP